MHVPLFPPFSSGWYCFLFFLLFYLLFKHMSIFILLFIIYIIVFIALLNFLCRQMSLFYQPTRFCSYKSFKV